MRNIYFLIVLFVLSSVQQSNGAVVITKTDVWKYKDNGSNLGTTWKNNSYNDSSWAGGAAELGYGDNPVTTLSASKITYYFRKSVVISNLSSFANFTLKIRRDDGIVVYLNGVEIVRNNMPSGTIAYTTLASANASDDGNTVFTYTIPASAFINGNNTIAAEVHNRATSSSDITFELELISNAATLATITRGPYLQSTTPGSTFLKWRTNTATDSKVQWGLTTGYGNAITDPALVTEHQIQITGLTANSKYFYSIGTIPSVLQGTSANYFWTAPLANSNQPVRIWAIGDFGNGSAAQQGVLNSYLTYLGSNRNDMWLWLGDNAYNAGTDAEFQSNVFAIYGNQFKSWNFYPALGNHDYANIGYQSTAALGTNFPYFSIFTLPTTAQAGGISSGTEKYYSYNWANIHFINLDSYGALNNSTSAMYTWLQNDLAANTKKWTIVYFHHPPYTKGSHNSDTDAEMINIRQNIVPLLETYKVDLVLSGHSHTYERSYFIHGHYGLENTFASSMIVQPGDGNASPYIKDATHNGTVYAVCGVSGQTSSTTMAGYPHNAMITSFTSITGSLVLEVNGDTLHYKFLKSDGTIPDQFTMIKSGSTRIGNTSFLNNPGLLIYPNPTSGIVTLKTGSSVKTNIEIYNSTGSLILTEDIFDEKTFDLSYFSNGEYEIIARAGNEVWTKNFLIAK